jgi:hypothetical protein
MAQQLAPALVEFQRLFTDCRTKLQLNLQFALIGGLAVSTWGVVRATQDIDFIADCDPSPISNAVTREALTKILQASNCRVEWRVGDYDDPIPLLLHLEMSPKFSNVGVDVLWAHKNWQREAVHRAISVDVEGTAISVLHPEDLILMKLDAGGPQDITDVEALLATPTPQLNLASLKKSAARLRLSRLLEKCLQAVHGKK